MTKSGFPSCSQGILVMDGSGGFCSSSLIPWCLHVSYHVEEFDNTARYHNHQDEAGSIK